jgi:hypothetical protein
MHENQLDTPQIALSLKFVAPDGEFFVRLQRLLDILTVSTAGSACMTDGPYMDVSSDWTVEFAKNERLRGWQQWQKRGVGTCAQSCGMPSKSRVPFSKNAGRYVNSCPNLFSA